MSRAFAFLYTFFITIALCFTANAAKPKEDVLSFLDKPTLSIVVAELTPPPNRILIEHEKILKYQLRHRYTVFCKNENYGAMDFIPNGNNIESVLLVSGQSLQLGQKCDVKAGNPTKTTYTYKVL